MLVVSDATPLSSLMKAGRLTMHGRLFGEVRIPNAVYSELTADPSFRDEAAKEAFAELINDATLNTAQIDFVKRVISYVETNGYMELERLGAPLFNRPSFTRLFDRSSQQRLIAAIKRVRDNALEPAA